MFQECPQITHMFGMKPIETSYQFFSFSRWRDSILYLIATSSPLLQGQARPRPSNSAGFCSIPNDYGSKWGADSVGIFVIIQS